LVRINKAPDLPNQVPVKKGHVPKEKPNPEVERGYEKEGYVGRKPADDPKLYGKPDAETIARLKEASDKTYQGLRQLVEQLLMRQGRTLVRTERFEALPVDDTARAEASAMIAEGGELSAEAVSDRIVDFAKALSGGDPSKIALLRGAIDDGFKAATSALGGTLPEVSQRTYDLVMQKLDAWENGVE
jgi:hypothetical protein